jgi:hypothetical protein
MNPLLIRHGAAILAHLRRDQVLSTLPPGVRGIWLGLVLGMLERPHTRYGLPHDRERLAEIAVAPVAECERAVAILMEEGALTLGDLALLRSPFLMGLLVPVSAR